MKKLILSFIVTGATAVSLLILTSPSCSSPDQVGGGDNEGGANTAGTPIINLDAAMAKGGAVGPGAGGNSGNTPTDDANCGSQTNNTTKQPADVLLVLDRSGSMNNDIAEECLCVGSGGSVPACADKSTCKDRWTTVSSAVVATVSSTPDIQWGLKLYTTSGGSSCNVSNQVEVPIGPSSAASIQSTIAPIKPGNNTPTAAAITAATTYLKGVKDSNTKVILLATDGQPNCKAGGSSADTDVEGTVAAIKAASDAGFRVYVIGIGPSVGNLDNFAVAGGTTQHYPATSPDELAAALAAISTTIASCTFTLAKAPPDTNNVAVYLDKNLVANDPANGWSFGGSTQVIQLNGTTCEKVKSGQAGVVQVLLGCPQPPQLIP
jgi:hypothetical protein